MIELLPPAAAWSGNSERLIVAPQDRLATPLERSGFLRSPNYADTIAYLKSLDEASDLISLRTFGKSFKAVTCIT